MKKIQVSQQQRTRLQVPTFRCPGSLFLDSELFFPPLSEMQTMHFRGLIVLACFSGLWRSRPDSGVAAPLQPPLAQRPVQTNKQANKKKTAKNLCEIWMEILKNVKQNAGCGLTWYESTSSGCNPSKGFDMDAFKCRQNIKREPQRQDVGGDFRVSCQLTQVAIIPGGQLVTSTRSRY